MDATAVFKYLYQRGPITSAAAQNFYRWSAFVVVFVCIPLSACTANSIRQRSTISQLPTELGFQRSSRSVAPAETHDVLAKNNVMSAGVAMLEDRQVYRPNVSADSVSAPSISPKPVATLADIEQHLEVTLDVENLELSELLSMLAQEADIDVVMAGVANLPVTLKMVNRSMADVLDLLAEQTSLGWQFRDGAVFLFKDVPVVTNYPVNYLNIERRITSSLGLATQVGSITLDASSASSGAHSNNSDTRIENLSVHNLWKSLEVDLDVLAKAVGSDGYRLVVNREAGLVTVFGNQRVQKTLRRHLRKLESSLSRQVVIEATVVEINLSDAHREGVDWSLFLGDETGTSDEFGGTGVSWSQRVTGQAFPQSAGSPQSVPSSLARVAGSRSGIGSISATIDLLQEFGDVRILSRPQIIALNNQSAVLKVVDNRVYFSVDIERTSREEDQEVSTRTRIHTVPIGLVMNVIPFVTEDKRVVLNVRPSISRILGFAKDPNPELSLGGVQNSVPEIQVREMESVLSVRSGETVVIGGLMQEVSTENLSGLPGLVRLPVLGKLFGQSNVNLRKSELLVFLKPTIVEGS